MKISTTDAKGILTKALADVYKERISPLAFLRSFFKQKEFATASISIAVERGTEKLAVDVMRGSEGKRNNFGKSSEKMFIPPYFREFFEATELDLYDRVMGSESVDTAILSQLVSDIADKMRMLMDKIDRAYELQCSQVLETGILELNEGTNIDFKRKAGSLVDLSASPWTAANSPYDDLQTGCQFIREKGKSQGGTLNAILGTQALNAFLNNSVVKERADIRNYALDTLNTPQKNAVGGTLHGEVSCGSFNVRLWSYNEVYDNESGVSTPYVHEKKVILLPDNPRFLLAFAAVPQLIDSENPVPKKGAYVFGEYKDLRKKSHIYDVESAGIAVPVAVDQIYTAQVVA